MGHLFFVLLWAISTDQGVWGDLVFGVWSDVPGAMVVWYDLLLGIDGIFLSFVRLAKWCWLFLAGLALDGGEFSFSCRK